MIRKALAVATLGVLSSGCAMSMNNPVTGALYSGTQGATAATSNPIGGKKGESCAMSILGIIGLGDSSIATAAKAGGVSKVSTVDSNNFQVLGIYAKNCTVVTGE